MGQHLSVLNFFINPINATQESYERKLAYKNISGFGFNITQINNLTLIRKIFSEHGDKIQRPLMFRNSAQKFKANGFLFGDRQNWKPGREHAQKNWMPENLPNFADSCQTISKLEISQWPEKVRFDLKDRLSKIAIQIAWQNLFNKSQLSKHELEQLTDDISFVLNQAFFWLFQPIGIISQLNPRTWATSARVNRIENIFLKYFPDESKQNRIHALNLLIASYETTSTTLIWALQNWSKLANNGVHIEKNDIDIFLKEVIRMHPPGYLLLRECVQDIKIDELQILKGQLIAVPIYWLHRDGQYFTEPEKFQPHRFQDEIPKAWLPFGLGENICLGVRFAVIEIRTILTEILEKYAIELTGNISLPEPHISLRPSANSKFLLKRKP